jgi:hypothetical protein
MDEFDRNGADPLRALGVVRAVAVIECHPALRDPHDSGSGVGVGPAEAEHVGAGEAAERETPSGGERVAVCVLPELHQLARLPVLEVRPRTPRPGPGAPREPNRVTSDCAVAQRHVERLAQRNESRLHGSRAEPLPPLAALAAHPRREGLNVSHGDVLDLPGAQVAQDGGEDVAVALDGHRSHVGS